MSLRYSWQRCVAILKFTGGLLAAAADKDKKKKKDKDSSSSSSDDEDEKGNRLVEDVSDTEMTMTNLALRRLEQPIRVFGESHKDRVARLQKAKEGGGGGGKRESWMTGEAEEEASGGGEGGGSSSGGGGKL